MLQETFSIGLMPASAVTTTNHISRHQACWQVPKFVREILKILGKAQAFKEIRQEHLLTAAFLTNALCHRNSDSLLKWYV